MYTSNRKGQLVPLPYHDDMQTIFDAMTDSIVVLDASNVIEMCNEATCHLFGFSKNQLVGKKITDLIKHINEQDQHLFISPADMQVTNNAPYEALGTLKDGSTLPIEFIVSETDLAATPIKICVIRNISKRKKNEKRIALLYKITSLLATYSSLDEASAQILNTLCEVMALDEGELWKVDKVNNLLRCINIWSDEEINLDVFTKTSKEITFKFGEEIPGKVWQDRLPCTIEDIAKYPSFKRQQLALDAGLHSAFALPVLFKNEVTAVLVFFTRTIYPFEHEIMLTLNEVCEKIGLFIEREHTQKHIETLSRHAGMADTASSVLHNLGNILNSVNVSLGLLHENINDIDFKNLVAIAMMLKENLPNLSHYLTEDPKGKLIPEYLISLIQFLDNREREVDNEIQSLIEHFNNIENIIVMQKSISGISGLAEKISLPEIIDTAILMCASYSEKKNITVTKDYKSYPVDMLTDKSKLLKILANLIQNSQDSLCRPEYDVANKHISIQTEIISESILAIMVSDNGIGIEPENITKIFSLSYSTKASGHGLGLHSSAIAANELGGSLVAKSDGRHRGATFILTLPFTIPLGKIIKVATS